MTMRDDKYDITRRCNFGWEKRYKLKKNRSPFARGTLRIFRIASDNRAEGEGEGGGATRVELI